MFSGLNLRDTQTGLRAIPQEFLPQLLELSGRGYDFETEMLMAASRSGVPVCEVPIETVYIDGNQASHFNPFLDSLKIYFVFLRFTTVSVVTVIIDYLIFGLANLAFGNLLLSFCLARLFAGTFNFRMGYRHVFKARGQSMREAGFRYLLLLLTLMACSYYITRLLSVRAGVNVYLAKALVETALFFTSFTVQRLFVFKSRQET